MNTHRLRIEERDGKTRYLLRNVVAVNPGRYGETDFRVYFDLHAASLEHHPHVDESLFQIGMMAKAQRDTFGGYVFEDGIGAWVKEVVELETPQEIALFGERCQMVFDLETMGRKLNART